MLRRNRKYSVSTSVDGLAQKKCDRSLKIGTNTYIFNCIHNSFDKTSAKSLNDIRFPAPDQVTDYIVLYNVSRETNNCKHNAWLQNKQEKVATYIKCNTTNALIIYENWYKRDAIDCIQLHCSTRPLPGHSTMSKNSHTKFCVTKTVNHPTRCPFPANQPAASSNKSGRRFKRGPLLWCFIL